MCLLQLTILFVLFFFFQAEDGIRGTSVTGVQTCALPIWVRPAVRGRGGRRLGVRDAVPPGEVGGGRPRAVRGLREGGGRVVIVLPAIDIRGGRSEERRVGKESTSGRVSGRVQKTYKHSVP